MESKPFPIFPSPSQTDDTIEICSGPSTTPSARRKFRYLPSDGYTALRGKRPSTLIFARTQLAHRSCDGNQNTSTMSVKLRRRRIASSSRRKFKASQVASTIPRRIFIVTFIPCVQLQRRTQVDAMAAGLPALAAEKSHMSAIKTLARAVFHATTRHPNSITWQGSLVVPPWVRNGGFVANGIKVTVCAASLTCCLP